MSMAILPRGPGQIYKALVWSLKGLRAAFVLEDSFRLEVYLFLLAAPVAFWLGENAIERVILFGCLLPVLAAELLNSSVEQVVDKISPEFAVFAGLAKDMGSAAVFLLMVNAVVCWTVVLWP